MRLFIVLPLSIFLLFSCSRSAPVIQSHSAQHVLVQEPSGRFVERFSLFVYWTDADGAQDFSSITLTHQQTGLWWTISPETAVTRLRGRDRWTGSNALAGPGGQPFPSGNYVLAVTDLAGNEAVRAFTVNTVAFPDSPPVSLSIEGGRWTLVRNAQYRDFSRTFFFLLDAEGTVIHSWRVPDSRNNTASGTIDSLKAMARGVAAIKCYIENSSGSAGVLLLPVEVE